MSTADLIDTRASADDDAVQNSLQDLESLNDQSIELINNKNKLLIEKNLIQESQLKALSDKEKVLLTRSRMLQISQDRNSFRTKILYTLVAIIIVILIITLFVYSMKGKKINGK